MKIPALVKNILFIVIFLCIACDKDSINTPTEVDKEPFPVLSLPQVFINTEGNEIVNEPKIDGYITIFEEDEVSYEGKIGIEIRGASSQMFPKKSFGFETRDSSNEDIDVSLFGFPEEEDWILYAPYSDKSLLRNILIYDLSRDIGKYASRAKLVEVSINDVYNGVYVFMEKLKRDGNRIDINKLKEEEISGENLTGGYILKIDKLSGSNLGGEYNSLNSFSSNGTKFLYEYPDAEDIAAEQKDYISTYVKDFETALISSDFLDEDLGYKNFIDTSSFIDFFIFNEFSNNIDGYRISTYITKEKNEKLKMGPIWDFNLAFGNANYCDGGSNKNWAYKFNERCPGDSFQVPFWWGRLLEDPEYVSQLKDRWNDIRSSFLSEEAISAKIEDYTSRLVETGAIEDNFNTWDILNTYVWPNNYVGQTYDNEVEYLSTWISQRLTWMDTAINNL